MKDFNTNKDGKRPSASFVVGAVALLFLIVGYQAALFIHKASVARTRSTLLWPSRSEETTLQESTRVSGLIRTP